MSEDDGLGNEFNSSRLIYKNDGITTKLAYVDTVGANCKKEYGSQATQVLRIKSVQTCSFFSDRMTVSFTGASSR